MPEHLLVLGGAGFVGSSLAIGLKHQHPDWTVTCLDNLRRRGSELNLPRFKALGIQFVHGDVRSPSDLDPSAFPVSTIIDCSAEPSVLAGFSSPQYVLQTNLLGTINILELARQVQAKLLFLSTSRIYSIKALKSLTLTESATRLEIAPDQPITGASPTGIAEDFSLQGARSLYGTTKLASELLIEEYRDAYNLSAIINRCGVLTGPWQMGKVDQGVFVLWMAAHYFKTSLAYIGFGGTGKQVRDLLHIQDLLRLVEYELLHFADLDGAVFNVGGGAKTSLSLLETTQLCQEITGNTIPIKAVPEERPGDIPVFITDSTKVTIRTGWEPLVSPAQTLQDIYQWLVEHESTLRSVLL